MIVNRLNVFLIVGGMTVVVDYVVYRGLVWSSLWDIGVSKALGFIAGSVFAYVVNRCWTFGDRSHGTTTWIRFASLYVVTLFINIHINDTMLGLTTGIYYSVQVAFLLATGMSAALNFLGMNYFVFGTDRDRRTK